MNHLPWFKKMVYAQVLLGMVAFCTAEQNPVFLLVVGTIAMLSWYVVEGPPGRVLPTWGMNVGAVLAVGLLLFELSMPKSQMLTSMSHFTMWLQLLELYGRKTNRDYGLILVLTVLQMTGASVLPGGTSIIFAGFLAMYCVTALLTLLLFQVKVTSEHVQSQNLAAAPKGTVVPLPLPLVGARHRTHLSVATLVIGLGCLGIGIVAFIVLPRTSRFDRRNEAMASSSSEVGFTEEVQLGEGRAEPSNRDIILHVKLTSQGKVVGDAETTVLLRGAVLDRYDPYKRLWTRSEYANRRDQVIQFGSGAADLLHQYSDDPSLQPQLEADITHRQANARVLFSIYPVWRIESQAMRTLEAGDLDQQLSMTSKVASPLHYLVRSAARMNQTASVPQQPAAVLKDPSLDVESRPGRGRGDYARGWRSEQARIRSLAEGVLTRAGLSRDPDAIHDPNDPRIAAVLTQFLSNREQFKYRLNAENFPPQVDPLVYFLLEKREGHCELFAAGLAAMARSLGMRARVITGYRASEFNAIGGYYVVRQANAHAWTEIDLGARGWVPFDATPAAEVTSQQRNLLRWYTPLQNFIEHVEYRWLNSVLAYDRETRERIFRSMQQSIKDAVQDEDTLIGRSLSWLREIWMLWQLDRLHMSVLLALPIALTIALAAAGRTWLLRRKRMAALQLSKLPRDQRRELARRLGFYLDMLDMLEKHHSRRPAWQSPQEFARSLGQRDPARFGALIPLTDHFYEIRFGYREMDRTRRDEVKRLLSQLARGLSSRHEFAA